MNLLKIELPSGSSRFVTSLDNNDIAYSIYSTNALDETPENINKLYLILETLKVNNL